MIVLNKVYISRGRMIEPERTGEVVVSEVFADAHGFVAGDKVQAIINGKIARAEDRGDCAFARVRDPSATREHHAGQQAFWHLLDQPARPRSRL